MIKKEHISKVLGFYGINFKAMGAEKVYGSPSRTNDRAVVIGSDNQKYIVEKHHFWNIEKKEKLAVNIDVLKNNGFEKCTPYLKSRSGKFATEFENRCWMVIPFVENEIMKRPGYLDNGKMGFSAANALLKIYDVSPVFEMNDVPGGFSMIVHTQSVISKIKSGYPGIFRDIKEVITIINDLFLSTILSSRIIFSHGDYHPMNILWKNDEVMSVIDWEFSGYRPALTDVANMIGCAGFEDITAFDRNFVNEFLKTVVKSGFFNDKELKELMTFVLGFRLSGWLNEWINDNDEEMINREIKYLNILKNMI